MNLHELYDIKINVLYKIFHNTYRPQNDLKNEDQIGKWSN